MQWLQTLRETPWGETVWTAVLLVLCAVATHLAARLVNRTMRRLVERQRSRNASSAAVTSFLRYVAIAGVYFAGLAVMVSCVPALESALTKLLAAGGVLAVVAGLAAQEALGSVVSGMMILAFKPFQLGDVVRYLDGDVSGVIEEITLHHTVIRTWENKRIIVPNSKMNTAVLENADYGDSRVCVLLEIGITYESDVQTARQLIEQAVLRHPAHLDHRTKDERAAGAPEAPVVVLRLDDSAVVLRASLWARDNAAAFALKCAVQEEILTAFPAAGVDFAYPHLVVAQQAQD